MTETCKPPVNQWYKVNHIFYIFIPLKIIYTERWACKIQVFTVCTTTSASRVLFHSSITASSHVVQFSSIKNLLRNRLPLVLGWMKCLSIHLTFQLCPLLSLLAMQPVYFAVTQTANASWRLMVIVGVSGKGSVGLLVFGRWIESVITV